MTPPVDDPEKLRRILADTDALLLDFDGPICAIFDGVPASLVADRLRRVLADGGYTKLPNDIRGAADPFDVLFYAAKLGPDEARFVEAAFRAHEVAAATSAAPTPNAHDLLRQWAGSGRAIAIVSNNSTACVETYVDIHRLRPLVSAISARVDADVSRLKPSSTLILDALEALHRHPAQCALIGDSTTDVRAAQSATVRSIAYANKPGKSAILGACGPDVITTSMDLSPYL